MAITHPHTGHPTSMACTYRKERKTKKLEQFLTLVALVELGITSKPVETPPLQSVSDGASFDVLVAANNQISHNQ
jgi:hypothetical protein